MNSDVSTGICVKVRSNVLGMGRVGRGGAIVPALRWPGHSEPICAGKQRHMTSHHLCFRHAPACALRFVSAPAVAVVAVVPEGTQNSRALSLCVSFHHVKKESQALLPKCGHFLKKSCLISRCKMLIALWFLILNRVFFYTSLTQSHPPRKYVCKDVCICTVCTILWNPGVAQGSGEEIITVSLWLYCQLLGYVSVSNDLFRCNSMSYYTNEAFSIIWPRQPTV